MRVCLLTTQVPFIQGGAEILTNSLHQELLKRKIDSEIVTIPFRTMPAKNLEACINMSLALDFESNFGSNVDRIIGLKFPTYYAKHKNKSVWLLHQHREVYDLWDTFPPKAFRELSGVTALKSRIERLDKDLLSSVKPVYTISKRVSERLLNYNQVPSDALYPPPADADQFHNGNDDGYLFFPSRLSNLKRQELVLRSLPFTSIKKIVFAGLPDNPQFQRELEALAQSLGLQDRVQWLGYISQQEKITLYSNARAIVFVPKDEDLGYITMEAMLSSKAVITCNDSGGPLEFVDRNQTGWVADPTPESLAAALEEAWIDSKKTKEMGKMARERYLSRNITWDRVISRLIDS